MYSHGILVMFVVLLTKCLKRLTNTRTLYVLVHMMATYTAFDYELVTWGNCCTWSLCHVHFHGLRCSLFREAKWPSTSSGSTVTIISLAKTRATHLHFFLEKGGVRINRVYGLLEIMWYFFSCDSKEAYKPR